MKKVLYPPNIIPQDHPPRIVTRFLLFPKTIMNEMGYPERRWLEKASWLEEFVSVRTYCGGGDACGMCLSHQDCNGGFVTGMEYFPMRWISSSDVTSTLLETVQKEELSHFDQLIEVEEKNSILSHPIT